MTRQPYRRRTNDRRGTVIVLTVLFLTVFLTFAAIVIDVGYLVTAKAELQRTADAAALGACWEYATQAHVLGDTQGTRNQGFSFANSVAGNNSICKSAPTLSSSDVQWGYLSDLTDRNQQLDTCAPLNQTNAVSVLVRKSAGQNGLVPSFFARIMGVPGYQSEASATAGIVRNIRGFATPADGSNLDIIPFAMDEDTWDNMLAGGGTDSWSYDPVTKTVSAGSDGVREVNLYPFGTGAPGNRGTVDIGSSNNSTNDISRQILHGVSPSDLAHHGGKLELNSSGELILNGDTGLSAGIKDELAAIIGKPRVIPIFREVHGPGNNADYTIVRFAGIRILYVKLTGSMKGKKVIIQPAPIVSKGVIQSSETYQQSDYVYSTAVLVR